MVMFAVRNGLVRSKKEFHWERLSMRESNELLPTAIQQFYHGISYIPKVIIVQNDFESRPLLEQWLSSIKGIKVEIRVPQRGKKKNLLNLAVDNARLAWKNRYTISDEDALRALQEALSLPDLPRRIDCFDISNIQGTDSVASMVTWIDGKPRKSEYRKYKIKTVEGADDFASMREVVERRYTRLIREEKELPDLVLIDGGKGQLSAAAEALDRSGAGNLGLASIAKREEILYTRDEKAGIKLKPSDPALKLVQRIRDEAHRFAVTFHRSRRAQRTLTTHLKRIPGIGAKRAKKLLIKFGSIERVKAAGFEEIAAVIGEKNARAICAYLGDEGSQHTEIHGNSTKDIS
jgi:excinuclease ABC subunit C